MGLENEDFSDEDQCQCMYTWEFFAYSFFGIRKTPIRKISTNQTSPWWIPPGIFPPMFLKIPGRVFWFFFHYCYRYHWYYLKDCFVILFQKWLGLYVCENLSKGSVKWKKIINEMGGDILVRIFCVAIFRREVFLGGVWIFRVGIFRAGIPLRGIFLKPFFSYNVSILTFQKIITRYNKSFNKKIYTLNS